VIRYVPIPAAPDAQLTGLTRLTCSSVVNGLIAGSDQAVQRDLDIATANAGASAVPALKTAAGYRAQLTALGRQFLANSSSTVADPIDQFL
jgi:hypothetical protein